MAKTSSVSLVEVSPSTVIALNERALARVTIAWSTGAGIAASVKTKASMVAMSGAIIPEPLAMPETMRGTPSMSVRRVLPLG